MLGRIVLFLGLVSLSGIHFKYFFFVFTGDGSMPMNFKNEKQKFC